MIGTLILSHGKLADELVAAAGTISGCQLDNFEALSLDWSDGFEQAEGKIRERLAVLDQGDGVLILTDMFGGTPCNVALTCLEPGRVEIVTGVNLPMVVRLSCLVEKDLSLDEVARLLQTKVRRSICVASETLAGRERPGDQSSADPAESEDDDCVPCEAAASTPAAVAAPVAAEGDG